MRPREVLEAAKKRIDTPEKLLQDGRMRDRTTGRVCSLGAIEAVTGQNVLAQSAYDILVAQLRGCEYSVGVFNDSHTHAEVMALFDRAIEAAS